MSAAEHRRAAAGSVTWFDVVTLSDTRGPDSDPSGDLIESALTAAGHECRARHHLTDDPAPLAELLEVLAGGPELVVTTGGTGLAPRDNAADVVARAIERPLPGFGELFRHLSYAEVGPAAMLSNALAGTRGRQLLVSLPGSRNAVRLALDELLVPELPHLLDQLRG